MEKDNEKQKEIIEKSINDIVINAIIEKPITFKLDGRFFYIYPPSLGITFLVTPYIKQLEIDNFTYSISKEFEFVKIAIKQRDICLRVIALHSFKNRKEAIEEENVEQRIKELTGLEADDIASIILTLLEWGTYQEMFIKEFGIDVEQKQKNKISDFKQKKGGSITFGGRSLFGSMLDMACERYKWTLDYLLWGISALNLNMMIADTVTSMYLSKEDAKACGVSTDGIVIKADDPKNREKLKALQKQINNNLKKAKK